MSYKLKDKVEVALNETRLCAVGLQLLIGFHLNTVLRKPFQELPYEIRAWAAAAMLAEVAALALMLHPTGFHRIAEGGEVTRRVRHVASRAMHVALAPFAFGLTVTAYVTAYAAAGPGAAALLGGWVAVVTGGGWYGLGWVRRSMMKTNEMSHDPDSGDELSGERVGIGEKIKQVLIEARVVLPGAQALLGFGFALALTDEYKTLPASSRNVHLLSLAAVTLAVTLLMAPAAYHRIAEHGEASERFLKLAGRLITAAMAALGIGLTGACYMVLRHALNSTSWGVAGSVLVLAGIYALWFAYPALCRSQSPRHGR